MPSANRPGSWEEKRKGVLVDILSEFVESAFEVGCDIDSSFLERVEYTHQDTSCVSTGRIGSQSSPFLLLRWVLGLS